MSGVASAEPAEADSDTPESLPVTFRIQKIETAREGALLAVATVAVEIADIEIMKLHMCIRRTIGGGVAVEMPTFRYRGERVACVLLPKELSEAIGWEVWDAIQEWSNSR